ncbi:flavin-containing monooxygenase [Nevskia ramosa]|uniref:flavin-containing monooxygenase n=1 Tax=Nevskia ramosa TaxID=64002 RepID=UPI002357E4E7|nr:alpha/beta hydrolase fold domain-containing protein [Nevskia ramosa]
MNQQFDVVVIGAGFAGLYATHRLRDDLGLNVLGLDAAGGVGGTWYWNRYPGARCDIESVHYSYSFSDELQREWQWSERYAGQPEILRYLEFVADKFDLRRSFRFGQRVTSMVWSEADARWTVSTDTGETIVARFVVAGSGNVTVPKSQAEFPGFERYKGPVYFTGSWPHEGVDFTGKRVGVIGTGSSGIQLIPQIAKQAAQVTVFQRTPNYAVAMQNKKLTPEQQQWNAQNAQQLRDKSRLRFLGVPYQNPEPSALEVSPETRRARYDELWERGGFNLLVSSYGDLLTDERANATVAEYVRGKIREKVKNPAVAEILCPTDHPYATKRPTVEEGYYEAFNRENVSLIDLRATPLEEVTEKGIRIGGKEHEFDAIALATGFDAVTGALLALNIVGRDGLRLQDRWAHGPRTYLGIASAGFPNLFTITGPTSAVILYNNPLAIEDHVNFAVDAIRHVLDKGAKTFEADEAAELAWFKMVSDTLNMTLFPRANSWYMGANIPGKPRSVFMFAGSAPLYREMCRDVVDHGYAGFSIDGASADRVPPMVRIDAGAALVVGAMLMEEAKPLEECSVDEARSVVESFIALQKPVPASVERIETTYPGPADARPVYIYRPRNAKGPLPVIVYLHGGGFIAGSIDMCAGVCGCMADDLQAIVVAPSYRLAPEAPFPAATDDSFAALKWTAANIARHGGDPKRLVVMGESAGGSLAAVAAQRARDEGGPVLSGQVLLYPTMDAEANTRSRVEYANGPVLKTIAALGMWGAYLGDMAMATSPLASPGRAKSLAGLAPALILSAECDPTCDEGEDYGRALQAAGVPVRIHRLEGLVHAVFYMSRYVPRAAEITQQIAAFLASLQVKSEVKGKAPEAETLV